MDRRAHRADHGENVPCALREEGVPGGPWRLALVEDASRGAGDRITQINTHVFRVVEGSEPPPCDGVGAPGL